MPQNANKSSEQVSTLVSHDFSTDPFVRIELGRHEQVDSLKNITFYWYYIIYSSINKIKHLAHHTFIFKTSTDEKVDKTVNVGQSWICFADLIMIK